MMQSRSKLWLGMVVLTAALFGIGNDASAKSIWAMTTDQNLSTPNGTTYSTCNNSAIWTQASGFDSGGAVVCLARSFSNGAFVTGSCLSNALTYRASVRATGTTFCNGTTYSWAGPISACHAAVFMKSSQNPNCAVIDLGVWGRGL
jgi:hypothetical protein